MATRASTRSLAALAWRFRRHLGPVWRPALGVAGLVVASPLLGVILLWTVKAVVDHVHARTESSHIFHMVPALSPKDHKTAAEITGRSEYELRQALEHHQARWGKYAYLWWVRETREIIECPPLPDQLRARTIVQRVVAPQ